MSGKQFFLCITHQHLLTSEVKQKQHSHTYTHSNIYTHPASKAVNWKQKLNKLSTFDVVVRLRFKKQHFNGLYRIINFCRGTMCITHYVSALVTYIEKKSIKKKNKCPKLQHHFINSLPPPPTVLSLSIPPYVPSHVSHTFIHKIYLS